MKIINKKVGETPLEALQKYTNEKATYVGRLDPMASGKLLVLTGEETKQKNQYQNLDKEYVVEILLDIESDTGDILGMPVSTLQQTEVSAKIVTKALKTEIGTQNLPYPAFSSRTVDGKPLFMYALEKKLDAIEIPTHEETIYGIKLLSIRAISSKNLLKLIAEKLSLAPVSDDPRKVLGADFRQEEIKKEWQKLLKEDSQSYQIIKIRVICGTGAYMRTLAGRLGKKFGTKALALSIHRTKIGIYKKLFSIPFWAKTY